VFGVEIPIEVNIDKGIGYHLEYYLIMPLKKQNLQI
jgi:hypothetical protein